MTPGLMPGETHDELYMGTGPMGVSAVKVFKLVVGVAEMCAQKLLGFDVTGTGGPGLDGGEFARVFVGLGAVELLSLGGEE